MGCSVGTPAPRLAVELAVCLAAASLMALMVILGGQAIDRTAPVVVATPTGRYPVGTSVATDVVASSIEPNAPRSTPCWMSDGPDAIEEPCWR